MTLGKFIEHMKHNSVGVVVVDPDNITIFNGTVGMIKTWRSYLEYYKTRIFMITPHADILRIDLGDEEDDN